MLNAAQIRKDQQASELLQRYPAVWADMMAALKLPDQCDRVAMMYSASYLCRTHGIFWGIDPVRLCHRLAGAPEIDVCSDIQSFSFILLTHQHSDHIDWELLKALRHSGITWVVPEAIVSFVKKKAGLPASRIIVPRMLETLELEGIQITPFEGLHWERVGDQTNEQAPVSLRGIPSTGYLVEFCGKRWLFPGDTRTYDGSKLRILPAVDVLFAHIWLGRGSALLDPPPLLEPFLRFCLDLNPGRVFLTHLNEFGRDVSEYWDDRHAAAICARFAELAPRLPVSPATIGQVLTL